MVGAIEAGPGAVNGYIRDSSTGEPLAYANVYLEATGYGAASNDRGYYFIGGVPPGEYRLTASYIGYTTARRRVRLEPDATRTVDLSLEPGAVEIDEIVVSAERARFEREVEMSTIRLDTRELQVMPKVGGELDIFRVIQLLPGVVSTSDFSNRLYIRGGSPDQNLILLDGITVYNPSHLFGMFSPFVPEAVSDATLLAGGFPAGYGGRLSSVLDVTTREGNSKRYAGLGSASPLAAKAVVEGPIPRGSFLVAARRTYLPDVILALFGVEGLDYYFYDLMGKFNHEVNHDLRLTLAGLAAEDVLSFWDPDDPDELNVRLSWGNRGLSLRGHTILTPTLYGETMLAWSNFFSGFRVAFDSPDTAVFATDLTDCTLKSDLTWYAADPHTVGFGVDLKLMRMSMRASFDTTLFSVRDTLWPLSAYVEDKWELVPERLFVRPGLRYSWYSVGNRHQLGPRIGVKYRPGENTAVNLSFGRFTQPMITTNSTDQVFSIYDMWAPVPESKPLPSALHYIAGVEHWLRPDLIVELEAYYKDYGNLLEVRYGEFATRPESLLDADGYSCGAELMLRRTEGWLDGWIGYSFMWTRRSIGDEVYHPHYDRRHNLNVVLNFPALFRGLDLNAKFTLGSGLPYSGSVGYHRRWEYLPGQGGEEYLVSWSFIDGPRDAFRYPVYHRLDVGLSRTWQLRWGRLTAFLDVANLYNARNVLLYYWDPSEDGLPERRRITMIPILPTVGIKAEF